MKRARLLMLHALLAGGTLIGGIAVQAPAAASGQRFVPRPADAYARFSPLPEPRASVPVGAHWVEGYGPVGDGAAPENLETIRGINGLTIGRNMQLSLTLGLLNMLNLDPGLRNQVTARFADLSIVRVKDLAALAGPAGEPRIYEALRAGTITITTDSNLSLNASGNALAQGLPVSGRGSVGRTRTYTLDARDMYLAIRVVTPMAVKVGSQRQRFGASGTITARLEDYRVILDAGDLRTCIRGAETAERANSCLGEHKVRAALSRPSAGDPSVQAEAEMLIDVSEGHATAAIPLPVAISDERGGLLSGMSIDLRIAISDRPSRTGGRAYDLSRESSADIALTGQRLVDIERPDGPSW